MATAIAGLASAGTVAAYMTSKPTGGGGGAAERADCPGKIICPITGDWVCIDQCPAERSVSLPVAAAAPLPACCAGKN